MRAPGVSSHPRSIFKGMLIGELTRIARRNSDPTHAAEDSKIFLRRREARGWPKDCIRQWKHDFKKRSRETRILSTGRRILFKVPFHPTLRVSTVRSVFTRLQRLHDFQVQIGYKLAPNCFLRQYSKTWRYPISREGEDRANFQNKFDGLVIFTGLRHLARARRSVESPPGTNRVSTVLGFAAFKSKTRHKSSKES